MRHKRLTQQSSLFLAVILAASVAMGQITIVRSSLTPGGVSAETDAALTSSIGSPAIGFSTSSSLSVSSGPLSSEAESTPQLGLQEFTATVLGTGELPHLSWTTTSEPEGTTFRVFRAEGVPLVPSVELTMSPIAGQGSETTGATYNFADPAPYDETERWYYLRHENDYGAVSFSGPILITVNDNSGVDDWMVY